MYSTLSACRAYCYMLARAADADSTSVTNHDCAAAILFCTEQGIKVALDAVQMLGGNGYSKALTYGIYLAT